MTFYYQSKINICSHVDSFTVKTNNDEPYTYVFQLCGDAGGIPGAGVIQLDHKTGKTTVIGVYNATQAIGGSMFM